ncbi:MAG: hypothetical protein PHE25_05635, partial [Candidatus Gracilibacteria bacterium]|nr:hypothetical protein [Candidatus Gracilibacteria bacterium]
KVLVKNGEKFEVATETNGGIPRGQMKEHFDARVGKEVADLGAKQPKLILESKGGKLYNNGKEVSIGDNIELTYLEGYPPNTRREVMKGTLISFDEKTGNYLFKRTSDGKTCIYDSDKRIYREYIEPPKGPETKPTLAEAPRTSVEARLLENYKELVKPVSDKIKELGTSASSELQDIANRLSEALLNGDIKAAKDLIKQAEGSSVKFGKDTDKILGEYAKDFKAATLEADLVDNFRNLDKTINGAIDSQINILKSNGMENSLAATRLGEIKNELIVALQTGDVGTINGLLKELKTIGVKLDKNTLSTMDKYLKDSALYTQEGGVIKPITSSWGDKVATGAKNHLRKLLYAMALASYVDKVNNPKEGTGTYVGEAPSDTFSPQPLVGPLDNLGQGLNPSAGDGSPSATPGAGSSGPSGPSSGQTDKPPHSPERQRKPFNPEAFKIELLAIQRKMQENIGKGNTDAIYTELKQKLDAYINSMKVGPEAEALQQYLLSGNFQDVNIGASKPDSKVGKATVNSIKEIVDGYKFDVKPQPARTEPQPPKPPQPARTEPQPPKPPETTGQINYEDIKRALINEKGDFVKTIKLPDGYEWNGYSATSGGYDAVYLRNGHNSELAIVFRYDPASKKVVYEVTKQDTSNQIVSDYTIAGEKYNKVSNTGGDMPNPVNGVYNLNNILNGYKKPEFSNPLSGLFGLDKKTK